MRFTPSNILTAADASTNQNTIPVDASYLIRASMQAVMTGSPIGSLQMQASNDPPPKTPANQTGFVPTNWNNIGSPIAISGAGTYMIPEIELSYQWIRGVYTATSGSGAITVNLGAKGF